MRASATSPGSRFSSANEYSRHVLNNVPSPTFDRTPAPVGTAPLLQDLMQNPSIEITSRTSELNSFQKFQKDHSTVVFLGSKPAILSSQFGSEMAERFPRLFDDIAEGAGGHGIALLPDDKKLVVLATPTVCSRHNSAARPDMMTKLLTTHVEVRKDSPVAIYACVPTAFRPATVAAIARAFPAYSRKTDGSNVKCKSRDSEPVVYTFFEDAEENPVEAGLQNLCDGVRSASALVDMPASELNTTAFVAMARTVATKLLEPSAGYVPSMYTITCDVVSGEELNKQGFGGIYGVGKAAAHPPAIVVLSCRTSQATMRSPERKDKNVVMVGKGIVYDTGGLSIKTKEGMPGMKRDMGGAAAVLQAFDVAVRDGLPASGGYNLYAILCLAENAVGPLATRPDDIHTLYSGKTVEINNTDAEGRLVLSDGVAFAAAHLNPTCIMDIATLTGAQGVATGRKHACVFSNDEQVEALTVAAGKESGDLCFPMPYCPEFFQPEFASACADMKNSVKDRGNATAACAAQFIADNLEEYIAAGKPWVHMDIASPSYDKGTERSTGFGVALLTTLLGKL